MDLPMTKITCKKDQTKVFCAYNQNLTSLFQVPHHVLDVLKGEVDLFADFVLKGLFIPLDELGQCLPQFSFSNGNSIF